MARIGWYGALGVLALGCSSDDEGCVRSSPCNIGTASCQRSVYAGTACLREQETEGPPPVRTATLEEVAAELRESVDEQELGNHVRWTNALALLGLVEAGEVSVDATIDTLLAQVAAYYSPTDRRVTVIDRGTPMDSTEAMFVLSHEFVHALQDQDVDLSEFQRTFADSTDSMLAVDSLVEGEASVLGLVFTSHVIGRDPRTLSWVDAGDTFLNAAFEDIATSEDPLVTALQALPYGLGTPLVGNVWRDAGQDGIDAFYEAPKLAAIDWRPDGTDQPSVVTPLECYPTDPPPGYAAWDHDTLGAAGVFIAYLLLGLEEPRDAWRLAGGWRNDSVVVFESTTTTTDSEAIAVAWYTEWSDPSLAERFAGALRVALPEESVAVAGTGVRVWAASDPELLPSWQKDGCGSESALPAHPSDEGMLAAVRGLRAAPPWMGVAFEQ